MGRTWGLVLVCLVACSADTRSGARALRVQGSPQVSVAYPELSRPLAEIPPAESFAPREEIELPSPAHAAGSFQPDPVVQSFLLPPRIPPTILNFFGLQGPGAGTPPDANGAVGPNHYVQTVNSNIEIWNKSGTVIAPSRSLSTLWTGYVGTNAGNGCAMRNDGDPHVLYDQLADRWFITQFSIPNIGTNGGPSFQCVAVSRTGDPTGQYWLYDFRYNVSVNDFAMFAVWPDAYLATFNMYNNNTFQGANLCAYNRANMLQGNLATQICFQQGATTFAVLPANADGKIPPPRGAPAMYMGLGTDSAGNFNNTLSLWKLQADFATPANSTLLGPTSISVAAYTGTCTTGTTDCVPQPTGGTMLAGLGDRLSFRLSYRNFGTHESLVANHSVSSGATAGLRWYEVRLPGGVPTLFQQGTYAPADGLWRWMGSIAQDQAQDFALGFSLSNATTNPEIGWTGRIATDTAGVMGQGEALLVAGAGHETVTTRWGDFDSMWVDPSDDCTFWYTNEYYNTSGSSSWLTRIASFKFPNCAANDFSISLSPATRNVGQGGQTTYTVTTANTAGTAETIVLNIQDLPAGVTGSFNPPSVTGASTSTLTLTASAGATVGGPVTFTVIGKSPSAVHAATGQVTVVTGTPAMISANPTSINFGNQMVGTTSGNQGVTIMNTGTATLTLASSTLMGPYNVIGLNLPLTVPGGGSTTFNVNFAPTAPGSAPGSVSIVNDSANQPNLTIMLMGVGTQPPDAAIDAPMVDAPEIDAATPDASGTGGNGGTAGSGGNGGSAGAGGSGGHAGTGGSGGTGGTTGANSDSGGCGCSTHGEPRDVSLLSLFAVGVVVARRRRRS